MQLKTFVKVGNITNLSDARYCAGMGVDVLGFKLDEDETSVSGQLFREISGWLSGTAFAGEFEQSDIHSIEQKAKELELDYIQVNDVQLANQLSNAHQVIYQLVAKNEDEIHNLSEQLGQLNDTVKFVLLGAADASLFESLNEALSKLSLSIDLLKGFDITDTNVLNSIQESGIQGIALYGSSEIRPGFKDYDELADILETLEEED